MTTKKKTSQCPICGHTTEYEVCETCNGSGLLISFDRPPPARITQILGPSWGGTSSITPCSDCDGTGIKGGRIFTFNAA